MPPESTTWRYYALPPAEQIAQNQAQAIHDMGIAQIRAYMGHKHIKTPPAPPKFIAPGEEPPELNRFSVAEFANAIEGREEVK